MNPPQGWIRLFGLVWNSFQGKRVGKLVCTFLSCARMSVEKLSELISKRFSVKDTGYVVVKRVFRVWILTVSSVASCLDRVQGIITRPNWDPISTQADRTQSSSWSLHIIKQGIWMHQVSIHTHAWEHTTHTHPKIVEKQRKSNMIMHDLTHNYVHTQSDVHSYKVCILHTQDNNRQDQ